MRPAQSWEQMILAAPLLPTAQLLRWLSVSRFRGGEEVSGDILHESKGAPVMAESASQYPEPQFHSCEFNSKRCASREHGQERPQIARELGVPERVLYRWRRSLGRRRRWPSPAKGIKAS